MPAVVGRAVARVKGYYPSPSGICVSVKQGAVFDVVEGHPVDGWADVLPPDEPAAVEPEQKPEQKTEQKTEQKQTSKARRQANAPPPADDIA